MRHATSVTALSVLTFFSVACGAGSKAGQGFMVNIAVAPESCGDGRYIVLTATGRRSARLNAEAEMPLAELAPRLRDVLRTRAEKLVYVTADADISWGEFLELIDNVWREADVVSLITRQVGVLAKRTNCLAPSCGQCATIRSFRMQLKSK